MIEHAKFLNRELEAMPENIRHLYDNTDKTIDETVNGIVLDMYDEDKIKCRA
jgi:hypothetical protein